MIGIEATLDHFIKKRYVVSFVVQIKLYWTIFQTLLQEQNEDVSFLRFGLFISWLPLHSDSTVFVTPSVKAQNGHVDEKIISECSINTALSRSVG